MYFSKKHFFKKESAMEQYEKVYNILEEMDITFNVVEHPPAFTTEEADSYIEGIEGARTKTLFLCNRKKSNYYMLIMDGEKRLDMKKLGTLIGEKGMTFGSTEKLMEKLSLAPGVVSLFGLLNNQERNIKVCLDQEMLSERYMSFHPNDNTKTIFIKTDDMYGFINSLGYKYKVIEL